MTGVRAACVVMVAALAIAPGDPLPDELRADFLGGARRDTRLCTHDDADALVSADVWWSTDERVVSFTWYFKALGKARGWFREESVACPFEPVGTTAVSDPGDVLYVLGYDEASGESLVERWTFETVVGTEAVEAADEPWMRSTLEVDVERTRVTTDEPLGVARDVVWHETSERLWILEHAAPNRVRALDPVTGSLETITDATEQPFLTEARGCRSWTSQGGGLTVGFDKWPSWDPGYSDVVHSKTKPTPVLVFYDADRDGVVDEVLDTEWTLWR